MKEIKISKEVKIALNNARKELLKYENKINPAHRWDHTKRVFNLCKEILKYYEHKEINQNIVLIAAALHDVGRIKPEGRHEVWSAEITKDILERKEFSTLDKEKTRKILEIIENHAKKDSEVNPRIKERIEFQIVVDADRIDSFGPIGIIRASLDERFQKSAKQQLDHIKEKSEQNNFKLNSNGGQKVGNKYKTYLYEFIKIYTEQEDIGDSAPTETGR